MPSMEEQTTAMTNRSLRSIRTELEYLTDTRLITPTQLSSILALLPSQTPLSAPLSNLSISSPSPLPTPAISQPTASPFARNPSYSEKSDYHSPPPAPQPVAAPPAYSHSPQPLATSSALYEYLPSDAGDLALLPHDRISITEFMNADWAKGRNERTGQEGIFPRSYVQIIDEKTANMGGKANMIAPVPQGGSGYGNVPLEVSQSSSTSTGGGESKFNQQGKKFGKKMGNAAIFGAGATIGSNIVNGIF